MSGPLFTAKHAPRRRRQGVPAAPTGVFSLTNPKFRITRGSTNRHRRQLTETFGSARCVFQCSATAAPDRLRCPPPDCPQRFSATQIFPGDPVLGNWRRLVTVPSGCPRSTRGYFLQLPPAPPQDPSAGTGAAPIDGIAGGAKEDATGDITTGATASKRASGRNESDVKSEVREVLSEGALCKRCHKLGIAKREGGRNFVLVIGRQCGHGHWRSAQHDCCCSACAPSGQQVTLSTRSMYLHSIESAVLATY